MGKYGLVLTVCFSLLLSSNIFAQNTENNIPNIAVLPFDGRGLSEDASDLLYNHFRGELVKTRAFVVLERGLMETILEEQGFQQTGCTTTECAVEAGKILNVQKMVSGIIGRIGSTWTINISLIDIESSRIEKSLNKKYRGEIDGLLEVLQEVAIAMMPPVEPISDIPLYVSGITAIASVGFGTYSYLQAQSSYDSYKSATTIEDVDRFKSDTENFDNITLISAITAGTATIFYFVYKYYYSDSKTPAQYMATPYINNKTYGVVVSINF